MLTRVVIVPVVRAMFRHARDFLDSYAKYVEDAASIPVHLVVARDDVAEATVAFAAVGPTAPVVHALEDLLGAGVHESSADLRRELGEVAFDALQTLSALDALAYDQALVLDADALVVKPTRLGSAFDAYFDAPYLLYSDPTTWGARWVASLPDAVERNAAKLLGLPDPRMYFGEAHGQFYDTRVVRDLIATVGSRLLSALRERLGSDRRVSAQQLVGAFIWSRREQYAYAFTDVNALLRQYLGADEYAVYRRTIESDGAVVGVLEAVARGVSERNLAALQHLFSERDFRFVRFDPWNANDDELQRLIAGSPIAVLVASPAYRRRRERIAVCLSGMPRNARQNVRFIRNFLAGTDVDVFFHFWETAESEYIARQLQPKAHAFEPTSRAPKPPAFQRAEKLIPPQRTAGTSSMFYSIGRANALKRAYEVEHGFRYDVVVRLRLDFLSTQSLADILEQIRVQRAGWERTVYVPDMGHSAGVNDQLALGSSDTMDTYAEVLGTLPRIAAEDYYNPEYILLRHVLRSGLRIRTFPFEYVLLRGDRVATLDLNRHVDRTLAIWWSTQLPEIPQNLLNTYFEAQADSVRLIDEIDADLARVFRLRCRAHGYLRFDAERRALAYTEDVAHAGLFYVVIPANEDRTVVNIRPRELVLASRGRSDAGATSNSIYPELDGSVRPDGPSDEDSAFFIRRRGDGILFEWRPGFWKRLNDDRGPALRVPGGRTMPAPDESPAAQRMVLQPSASGLRLTPLTEESVSFEVESIRDAEAEAVPLGLRFDAPDRIGSKAESLPVRLLRFTYLAARLVDQRGVRVMGDTARASLRKRAYAAEHTNARGFANRVLRRLAHRL